MSPNRAAGILMVIIGIIVLVLNGCSAGGRPSRARCIDLLAQSRSAGRECHRLLKAYESENCSRHPEQAFGADAHGGVGF